MENLRRSGAEPAAVCGLHTPLSARAKVASADATFDQEREGGPTMTKIAASTPMQSVIYRRPDC